MPDDRNERWRRLAALLQARWEAKLAEQRRTENRKMPDGHDRSRAERRESLEPLGQIQMICAAMAPESVTDAAARILQKAEAARVAQIRADEDDR